MFNGLVTLVILVAAAVAFCVTVALVVFLDVVFVMFEGAEEVTFVKLDWVDVVFING